MSKPDHEPRTWCPTCGAVCTTATDWDRTAFYAVQEPTIGTYTEPEIVKVFAERKRFQEELEDAKTPRPLDEWHEDIGTVLWWHLPVEEPPYVGTPLDDDWTGYHTHWTPILTPNHDRSR